MGTRKKRKQKEKRESSKKQGLNHFDRSVPSECTQQASTTRVLMLENAARTHEYSGLLSTHRWSSCCNLSI